MKPPEGPKADTSLSAAGIDDPMVLAATLHVVNDGMARAFEGVADELDKLGEQLTKVADPEVLVLARDVERIAKAVRPPENLRTPRKPPG